MAKYWFNIYTVWLNTGSTYTQYGYILVQHIHSMAKYWFNIYTVWLNTGSTYTQYG